MTTLTCYYADTSRHALGRHAIGKRIRVLRHDVPHGEALRIGRIIAVGPRGSYMTENTGYGHRINTWTITIELTNDNAYEIERLLAHPLPAEHGYVVPRPEVADVIGRRRATYGGRRP